VTAITKTAELKVDRNLVSISLV